MKKKKVSRKGIILAGGVGSRLYPNTRVITKHLFPIYDKPMIYYPLSTLMLSDIREILIISSPKDFGLYKSIFNNGSKWGIKIEYAIQKEPKGIAESLIIGEDFIGKSLFSLILGDNILFGNELEDILLSVSSKKDNYVFLSSVKDPKRFGIAEISKDNDLLSIKEKPTNPKSNLAVIGLYFYDYKVCKYVKDIKPSKRKELEISDLNKILIKNKALNYYRFGRGITWMDAGTEDSLINASQFIKSVQNRSLYKIACPEEIAFRKGWITKNQLRYLIKHMPVSTYSEYLNNLLKNEN